MEVIGYKCFNKDMTNNYGKKFESGKKYIAIGDIKFGNQGNGYHMCKNLEDTLRYFDYQNNDICICLVKGSGKIVENSDEYYGYYDTYSVECIEIIKKLNREEIIKYAINLNIERLKRFIACFKLTKEEIIYFKEIFKHCNQIIEYIEYYQENNYNVFRRKISIYSKK